jgi:hypothetical protein
MTFSLKLLGRACSLVSRIGSKTAIDLQSNRNQTAIKQSATATLKIVAEELLAEPARRCLAPFVPKTKKDGCAGLFAVRTPALAGLARKS